jgi:hypothetical protein
MEGRELLGAADVSDPRLSAMVADLLREDSVELLDVSVARVDYDLPAITTAGRWWVTGHVATSCTRVPFRIFVKQVQSWSRSPLFAEVPPEIAEMAAASVPWRTEPLVYRSDLADRLPAGLRMPRALGVFDLDELSAAVWLEAVEPVDWTWDVDRHRRAAHLLGRLAGSPRVAPRAGVGELEWTVHDYIDGRLTHQVLPMLEDDGIWSHPLVAEAFSPELRRRMLASARSVRDWVGELAGAPVLPGHGDACPNNLLGTADPETFVLIDYGFWMPLPLGFDLAQLLLGDIQIGRRPADGLAELDDAIVAAYCDGLAAEGLAVDPATVRRMHALQMLLFTGLSCLPWEHLAAPPSAALTALAHDRATIAAYCLDLVEATSPAASG